MLHSRIAPTPSGYLHIGNAYNFLLTQALVRRQGGTLRLRIDDLDAARIRPQYLEDIFETLSWLQIVPDAGPRSIAAQLEVFSQQLRIPVYDSMLSRLAATGRVFACRCSRADVARNAVGGQYAGTCRDAAIPLDTPNVAWRFLTTPGERVSWQDGIAGMQVIEPHVSVRDFVIRRRDGVAAYHVASLSDDLEYAINLIVRGADLIESSAAQLLLARHLGEDRFWDLQFFHHPLLLDPGGAKLSKSAGSTSLRAMRDAGLAASGLKAAAAAWYNAWL